ncbi:MAG: hypothetical protein RLW87_20465 [Alphaproteobacteria bacterium]
MRNLIPTDTLLMLKLGLVLGIVLGAAYGLAFSQPDYLDPGEWLGFFGAVFGAAIGVIGAYGVAVYQLNAARRIRQRGAKIRLASDVDALLALLERAIYTMSLNRINVDAPFYTIVRGPLPRTIWSIPEETRSRLEAATEILDDEAAEIVETLLLQIQVIGARIKPLVKGSGHWDGRLLRSTLQELTIMRRCLDTLLEWTRKERSDLTIKTDRPDAAEIRQLMILSGALNWGRYELDRLFDDNG